MRRHLISAVIVCAVAAPASALAGDRQLLAAIDRGLAPTLSASRAAAGGAPSAVQRHYDRARDLQEAIRAAAAFSAACHSLGGWAARYAAAEVASAEGFDRLQPSRARRQRRLAGAARARMATARRTCRPGRSLAVTSPPPLLAPRPGAATFGDIVARGPEGMDGAVLLANGAVAGPLAVDGRIARARLNGAAGRYNLVVRFTRAGRVIGTARSAGVWLLPPSARGASRPADLDGGWQSAVRAAAGGFSGFSGVWAHDLATGQAASWNSGARFPAASTVKLGLLVEALRRMGSQPERSSAFHDAAAVATWSSNLGTNRLLRRVGGSGAVQVALARLGATSSTFTGGYIVATERPPVDAPSAPPRVSRRVTTAHDMGAALVTLHDAARGDPAALRATRLTVAQARLLLGLLLSSEASGDNLGLFREWVGSTVPMAQKHGWISSARHSAAIVYTSQGPVVVVALTYRSGLSRARAAALGRSLVGIALS